MRIEVLTIPDCPNRASMLTRVRDALDQLGATDVEVVERVVTTATEADGVGMHGSPTVLVDSRDPFAATDAVTSVSCRLYPTSQGLAGVPPLDALIDAFRGVGTPDR